MSEPFVGEIRMVGFTFAPRGWAYCNGQLMAIAQNSALFALLGTNYGGDGVSTFGLPNLQGRVPIHAGTSNLGGPTYVMGQNGGVNQVTLSLNNMPTHNHVATATTTIAGGTAVSTSNGTLHAPTNTSVFAASGQRDLQFIDAGSAGAMVNLNDSGTATTTVNVGVVGGSQPFDIRPPYLVVNFIIALQGIFPSRN